MFLYDLGDSTILSREEEGRLSEIYQKGLTLENVTALLTEQLLREPTSAELADALTDQLHGLSQYQLRQVGSQPPASSQAIPARGNPNFCTALRDNLLCLFIAWTASHATSQYSAR